MAEKERPNLSLVGEGFSDAAAHVADDAPDGCATCGINPDNGRGCSNPLACDLYLKCHGPSGSH